MMFLLVACSEAQPRMRLQSAGQQPQPERPTPTTVFAELAFDSDQLEVITAINVNQLTPLLRWRAHPGRVHTLAFMLNGRRILSASSADNAVRVWNTFSGAEVTRIETENGQVTAAAVNPAGSFLLTTGENGNIQRWDVASGSAMAAIFNPGALITSMAYSVDGTALAVGFVDGTIQVRDAGGSEVLLSVSSQRGRRSDVFDVALSPDLIVGAYSAGNVVVWDRETGERLDRLTGHSNDVLSATVSRDGDLLATTSSDNSIRVWDAATLEGQYRSGTDFDAAQTAFHPEGTLLASTGQDGTLSVWNMATGRRTYRFAEEVTDGTFWTYGVVFSPDGKMLAYGNDAGEIVILVVKPSEETETTDESD